MQKYSCVLHVIHEARAGIGCHGSVYTTKTLLGAATLLAMMFTKTGDTQEYHVDHIYQFMGIRTWTTTFHAANTFPLNDIICAILLKKRYFLDL